jgi:hypothetical protein
MKRFSTLKPQTDLIPDKDDVEWSNDYISIINYKDWSVIKESDFVVCIIYLIEENQFILRNEYIPTFEYVDGQDYHMTVLSGTMKQGESPEKSLLREIEEEAGIVIRPDFKIEFMKPLFLSKGHSSKYHPALITLTERDYHEVMAKGDGSKVEKMSQTVKLDLKYIKSVNSSDLITDYMLEKFKSYVNQ